MMGENIQKHRYLGGFLPDSDQRKLVLLTGARQTGKTTLVKKQYPDIRYINLDAPENRDAVRSIPTSSWAKDVGNAVIDEAQKEPVVFDKVKYAYDEGSISFEVILGSSQILLMKKIRESLAGRVSVYELWPLLMSEVCRNEGADDKPLPMVDRLLGQETLEDVLGSVPGILMENEAEPFRRAEDHLLKWGGMPALLPLSDDERRKWLKDYEYTYLERDLVDLARIDDLAPFRKFQKLAALRSGKLLNYSEIARDTSISVDTAKRYLEYLRISYQVVLLQPYSRNITSSTVKTPKLYWLDVGLLRQLSGYTGENAGNIYETMVVGELIKWIKTAARDSETYFYRTRSGMELDIILQTAAGIIGMEVKSRPTLVKKDVTSMKEVAKGLGDRWRGGIVVYRGNEIKRIDEPCIWAVPSYRLFT